ncbi:neurofilament heavy polypeptide isoform X2 [Camponotus floridanus]|uniref:neurofilament heavy polypeptide isoform X2 n=1 Tax=Camponotus floridanus TaxID=104421 RepID=UPI00059D0841|nr:neurofilament heavy polypeptide isoform X2 [Camponotus floridanus]
MGGYAWVTLATNDAYSLGALVLAHSLRRVGTKYELACLVTPGVTAAMREKLAAVFSLVQEVNVLDSKDEANLALLARPELGITFTKLHCWRLTQYEKCVFVDADALVVRNCDELFEREELSAAPDVGWPDCFNSGVFVFRPSQQTFASITAFAAAKGSFDGGDQGLLNMYFSDWASKDISKHLPFIYNMCSTATYSYLPAFKQFGDDVRIIHFIGITKPWLQYFDTLTGVVQPPSGSMHLQPLLQLWWNIFCEQVHPQLSPSMTGIAGALAQLTLGEARSVEQIAFEEHMRKQSWEQGQIDYMGRDSFDNIWKKICETLSLAPQRQSSPPKEDAAEPKESAATVESVELKTVTPIDVEVKEPVVEADKDLTQSLVCEASEEKLSAAQTTCEISDESVTIAPSSEQEAPALSSEDSITVQSAAIKVSSELSQPDAIESAKPTDTKLSETSTEQSSQELTPQSKSESLPVEAQQTDSEASTCLLADAVCKKEVITPVTQIESEPTPTETKLETPVSATQDATELTTTLSVDSPQSITAPSETSEASLKETAKDVIQSDVMQPLTIDPSEQHADVLLAASEISTISPVPIQVAESVLQAEPKESVSDATAADQAIATTVTAVHESTDIASASIAVEPVQLNGSVCEKPDDIIATAVAESSESSDISIQKVTEPASDLVITTDVLEAPSATIENVESVSSETSPETPSKVEELTESAEQIVKTETTEPAEQANEAEITEVAAKSSSEISETSEIVEPSSAEESTEAKELNIPSTPTVIEATPPTSPSVESTQEAEEKQAGKKSLKKSDSADVEGGGADGESADKKAKKTVKKVTKKPKTKSEEATPSTTADGATVGDGSQSKVKKTVKITKKTGAKTLETDTSVPETPPPPSSPPAAVTSDVPVPPKRKTKSTNAKGTTGKKSETEE